MTFQALMENCLGGRMKSIYKLPSTNTSGFRGVSWHKDSKKWVASIRHGNKRVTIGRYKDKEQAARAYDDKARELKGRRAMLNFPTKDEQLLATIGMKRHKASHKPNKHGYRGIAYRPSCVRKWHAQIVHQREYYSLGFYKTAEEAARAYDRKAIQLHGLRARLNFPNEMDDTDT